MISVYSAHMHTLQLWISVLLHSHYVKYKIWDRALDFTVYFNPCSQTREKQLLNKVIWFYHYYDFWSLFSVFCSSNTATVTTVKTATNSQKTQPLHPQWVHVIFSITIHYETMKENYRNITGMLHERYRNITGMLQECFWNVTWTLQERYWGLVCSYSVKNSVMPVKTNLCWMVLVSCHITIRKHPQTISGKALTLLPKIEHSRNITGALQECCRNITGILQECYKNVTWM